MKSAIQLDIAGSLTLASRDLRRFFRQRSRIAGALGQPLLLWAIYGLGFGGSFRVPGAEQVSYLHYLYPGVLVMIVLFTAIFSTMSIIEDRHAGLLQLALVAPISRTGLVAGKALGGTAVACLQAAVFLLLAQVAGYPFAQISWGLLVAALLISSIGITALGFAFAWTIDSTQGYHGVMMLVLIPMWVLSGAMFPSEHSSAVLATIMRWNPATYMVELTRRALSGGNIPEALTIAQPSVEFAIVVGFTLVAFAAAAIATARRR